MSCLYGGIGSHESTLFAFQLGGLDLYVHMDLSFNEVKLQDTPGEIVSWAGSHFAGQDLQILYHSL